MVCLRQREQFHEITNLNARFGPDLAETMVSIYQTELLRVVVLESQASAIFSLSHEKRFRALMLTVY
jgi:hypothetical protein